MSLEAARGGGGKGGWSSDQLRWDATIRGHEAEAVTCRFGGGCRQGLNCPYRHSQEEIQIFVDPSDQSEEAEAVDPVRLLRARGVQVRRLMCTVFARCCSGPGRR